MSDLAPCGKVFGSDKISQNLPLAIVKSCLIYMPQKVGTDAGIFDIEGAVIPEAVNFRGEKRLPIRQVQRIEPPLITERFNGPTLIYIGTMYPHFGHFITTTLSRFWYLYQNEGRPVRLLCHDMGTPSNLFKRHYVSAIFQSLGISCSDFVTFSSPTIIESEVIFPEPSFVENFGANPVFIECCRAIGKKLLDVESKPANCPVYLSKARLTGGLRGFVNEGELEAELIKHGVRIVYPEIESLTNQINILSHHSQIMGSVGSALHSVIFVPGGKRILGLNQTEQINSNFLILDKLCENDSTYSYPLGIEEVVDPRFNRALRCVTRLRSLISCWDCFE